MEKSASARRSYELQWQFEPRLATDHLGSQKYSTSSRALGELVANALDAGASRIEMAITHNALGGVESLLVKDSGQGMGPEELASRFVIVGVAPSSKADSSTRLGRFGVGRLAVHRIGSLSDWVTVAEQPDMVRIRSRFQLSSLNQTALQVEEEVVSSDTPLGTSITISNLRDSDGEALTPARIAADLGAQFCGFLLGNPSRQLVIQGEPLDVQKMIASQEKETLPPTEHVPSESTLHHLLLHYPVERSRFPAQVVFSAKGRMVASVQPQDVPSPTYLGLVECPYLDSIVSSNRETLIEMDEAFSRLKVATLEHVRQFAERYRALDNRRFLERARREDFYPYRDGAVDSVTGVKQVIYDAVLEKVNEHANVEGMTKRQQAVVFRLLDRSLQNENLLEILHEVARLSDADMEKFRQVLERTTLDSIIRLSSEVTARLSFLNVLHELVYGDVSKHLKERTQLHRILEPQSWLFGPRFHLATSDQNFREVVRRHRDLAGLAAVDEEALLQTKTLADIPDLYMVTSRDYPVEPKHHHLLVELKAPTASLGTKQLEQVRRYARTVQSSAQFDKTTTRWDVVLISANATAEAEFERNQEGHPPGQVLESKNLTVWAFVWSEVITRARDEMHLVQQHLQSKSQELTVSEYLRSNFPEILEQISAHKGKS